MSTEFAADWPEQFEQILRGRIGEPPPLGELPPDLDLEAAGLDSLETIGLLIELEEQFEFVLEDRYLNPETFATPASLWAKVISCRSASG